MGGFAFRSVAAAGMLAGMAAFGMPAASARHEVGGRWLQDQAERIQYLWNEKGCIRTAENRESWTDLRRGYIYCQGPWAENLVLSARILERDSAGRRSLYASDSRMIAAEFRKIRAVLRKESGAELSSELRWLKRKDYLYKTGLAVSMIESEQYRRMGILGRSLYGITIYDVLEDFGIGVVVFLLVSGAR